MDDYLSAYKAVTELYCSLKRLQHKLPTFLVALAGELLVKSKLNELGIRFVPQGPQARCDILLLGRNTNNRIEVRTSTLKNEGLYPKQIMFHGWRIQDQKEDDVSYDFLVCVALDENLENPEFYLFTREEVRKAGNVEIQRFANVKKKLHLFRTVHELQEAVRKPGYVTDWEKQVNDRKQFFRDRWEILKGE